jgi:hypothetical protein
MVQVFVLWSYLLQLYGNFGFVQWAVIETGTDLWVPSIGKLCLVLQPYGISSTFCVYGVFALYILSLAGLFLGWKARAFGAAAWLLHGLTVNSGYLSLYGVDTMIHICLFYCVWMPVGDAFSLQQLLFGKSATPSFMARISLRTLQVHLCIIYLSTGIAKIRGTQWRNGEAIWRALMQPQFSVFDMSWLASVPFIAKMICWEVIVLELGYAFLIWNCKTRPVWVALIIGLHLSIGIFMGLWMFSALMIIMNGTAFGFDLVLKRRAVGV